MAGRPRKPKAQKVLQGTFRADQNPANEPAVEPIVKLPIPPVSLNRWGKKYWDETVSRLVDSGILMTVDLGGFEIICACWGRYKESEYDIAHDDNGKKRTTREYRKERGYSRRSMPEMQELRENWEQYSKLCKEFGLTPVSRNKIDLPEKVLEQDPIEELYKKKNG